LTVSRHPEDVYRCVGSRTESIELASDFGPPNQPTIQPGNTRAVTRTIRQHAHRATSIMNSVSRARFSSTELTRKSDGRTDGRMVVADRPVSDATALSFKRPSTRHALALFMDSIHRRNLLPVCAFFSPFPSA